MTLISNVKKIAILRANAVGDFLVTLPAIHALRKAYPQAEIVLLGKPWHQSFLKSGRSPVDRVLVVPVMAGIREEKDAEPDQNEIEAFLEDARKENFDLAINFQGRGIAANPFLKRFNARYTIGGSSKEAEPIDRSINYYYYQNETVRYMEIAALAGAKPVGLEPELSVLQSDLDEAQSFIDTSCSKPFIALHPCGNDIRRMWVNSRFAELADRLVQEGFDIVFTGSASERETVEGIISEMNYQAVNASGELSLGCLAALYKKSELVVSVDTGPLHLARSVNARTVGLYWAPNLINWGPLTRDRHLPVVSWKMECPLCGVVPNDPFPFEPKTDNCSHEFSFVADLSVEKVLKAALEQLKRQNSSGLLTKSL